MGRHRRDFSTPANRLPGATGDDSVWYGEAAGKLIFIEYIFNQQDFAAGTTIRPGLDIYNVFNSNDVLQTNQTYGPNWLRPGVVLMARLVKFNVLVNF